MTNNYGHGLSPPYNELLANSADKNIRQSFHKGRKEGEIKGQAKAVLIILSRRGVPISKEARQQIRSCTDPAAVERWLEGALTARSAEKLIST